MKKKRWTQIFLSIVLSIFMVMPVYAQDNSYSQNAKSLETDLRTILSTDNISRVMGATRGRVISSSELEISTDGNGMIGVYAEVLCHIPVKQIYLTIYLDVWNEETQDWDMVNQYNYVWNASDNPDRDLASVSVSFDVAGLKKGKTYSLRGLHAAKSFDGISEVMATHTSGIVLDDE